jgi:hypothetical protein
MANKSRKGNELEARLNNKGMRFTHVKLEPNKDDRYIWDVLAGSICSPSKGTLLYNLRL